MLIFLLLLRNTILEDRLEHRMKPLCENIEIISDDITSIGQKQQIFRENIYVSNCFTTYLL